MLEAYKEYKNLKELEARLPGEAGQVREILKNLPVKAYAGDLASFMLAQCHVLCDEPEAAKQVFQSVIDRNPAQVQAKSGLAKILFAEGDLQGAVALLRDATAARPEFHENWLLLSEYLQQDGQQQAAKDALKQYDMIKAFNDKLKQAEQSFAGGDFVNADKTCRQLLTLVPAEVRTLRLLARIAKRFHHFEISTSILAQCVETQPSNAALGLEYAVALLANNKHGAALEQCRRLGELAPENIEVYAVKAQALYSLGRYEEALTIYRELSNLHENRSSFLLPYGKLLKTMGKTGQAIDCYHESLQDQKTSAQAFWELANLRTYRFSDDEIATMHRLLKPADIPAIDKVLLQFTLGKVLEDEGRFAESFRYYQAANNGYAGIQPIRYSSQNAALKSFFTAEYFAGLKVRENVSDAPIFVVGLPRSGSTLMEQILTSHSMVDATRELTEIVSIARELNNPNQPEGGKYPASMADLSTDQIQALAKRYLDFAQAFRQSAPYFVDKAPGNFHHIGLIKTLFPAAKIIDIRRHPMASGWSLYRHFFADSFLFSYDLATIGKYHQDYIELMEHWHSVLPDQILTVSYEGLVQDLPAALERILAYCGLPFEQSCLDFHLNKRPVATPSSEQVRQSIYTGALDHWKNYEKYLGPLKSALAKR